MEFKELLILALLLFFEIIGGYLLKTANNIQSIKLYVGILSYAIVAYLFYLFLKKSKNIAISNIYWQIGNVFLMTLLSVLVLKEKLTKKQILGLFIVSIGIYTIES
jgi:multidrug transporter EmrE-like cation transporter